MPAQLAAFEAAVTGLSSDGALDAEDPQTRAVIDEQMSRIFALPGGAAALVARYAGDERVAVVRPLAFLLAVAVNDRDRAQALAATVLAMIDGLRTDDPWPRLNLCTAVQRLLMFGALGSLEPPSAAVLSQLLRESLAGLPALRATAATVIADLFYKKYTSLLPAEDLAPMRATLLALVDDADELTRQEAQGLREFLEKSSASDPA